MGTEHDIEPGVRLAAVLAEHPDAGVGALTSEGRFCPVPPSLTSLLDGHPRFPDGSPFDLVDPECWGTLINGWKHAQDHGIGGGGVRTVAGDEATIACFDMRRLHGVLVAVLVDEPGESMPDLNVELPLSARFGTFTRDVVGMVISQDDSGAALLGWELETLATMSDAELIHPDDRANAQASWLDMLAHPGRARRWRGRHRHADGSWRWLEVTNTNRLDDLEVGHVVSEMMDVSEEMAADEALRERQQLLDRLHDALPLGVCQMDRERRVVYANDQMYELMGCDPGDDLRAALGAVATDDVPTVVAAIDATLTHGTNRSFELHVHSASTSGSRVRRVDLRALQDDLEAITGVLACVSDITEATTLRRELEVRATIDQLTGCHNRASTMAMVERALSDAVTDPAGRGVAVIYADLDRFKPINDEFGHAAGDELLAAVAGRLRALVRDGDIVGRVGGDEFLVVCPASDGPDSARHVAERIVKVLAPPAVIQGRTIDLAVSVGVAWTAAGDTDADSLVAAADQAMYRSKRAGRSEVVLAD